MSITERRKVINRRGETRQPYSASVIFTYKRRLCQGELKNQSPSGLFIKTNNFFLAGEDVTVEIPLPDNKNCKRNGRIVWCNGQGFGVLLR